MTHMWQFTSQNGYSFKGWNNELKPQRDGDKFIMEEMMKKGYDKQKLLRLNKCRIYLQVVTLADITNGDGSKISHNYLNGRKDPSRRSKFEWTKQVRPNCNAWYEWAEAISSIFCSTDNGTTLLQSLGTWSHTKYHDWDWYFDSGEASLYYIQERHAVRYSITSERKMSTRSQCKWYKAREIIKSQIDTHKMERATIVKETKGVRLVSFQGSAKMHTNQINMSQKPISKTLADLIQLSDANLPPIYIHNFQAILISEIRHLFRKGCRIVADGSYKENESSYATIIESLEKKVQIVFSGATVENDKSYSKNTDPYRSEMMGLYMGLLLAYIMEQYIGITTTIILSCDNDSSLDSVGTYTYSNISNQHYGIIQSSIELRSRLESRVTIERVLGHADTKNPKKKATRTELLNQSCDFLAKHTRKHANTIGPRHLPCEDISIWKNQHKIYNNFENVVRKEYYKGKAQPILCDKFQWTPTQVQMVDWESNRQAIKLFSTYSTTWISKYVTGFLPIGVNMERRNEWQRTYCSRCRHEIETKEHIGKCKEATSTGLFQENLEVFEKWLDTMQTPSFLRNYKFVRP